LPIISIAHFKINQIFPRKIKIFFWNRLKNPIANFALMTYIKRRGE